MDCQDMHLLLGEIKGQLEMVTQNQENHNSKLDAISGRLSKAENRAAQHGMVTGAIAALGISFIKEKLGL